MGHVFQIWIKPTETLMLAFIIQMTKETCLIVQRSASEEYALPLETIALWVVRIDCDMLQIASQEGAISWLVRIHSHPKCFLNTVIRQISRKIWGVDAMLEKKRGRSTSINSRRPIKNCRICASPFVMWMWSTYVFRCQLLSQKKAFGQCLHGWQPRWLRLCRNEREQSICGCDRIMRGKGGIVCVYFAYASGSLQSNLNE